MKTLFFLLICTFSLQAQYYPLVNEGSSWAYQIIFYDGPNGTSYFHRIEIEADTLVNGIEYNKLFATVNYGSPELIGYVREEDKRIHFLPSGSNFAFAIASPCSGFEEELVLYDFNLIKGDTSLICNEPFWVNNDGTMNISGFDLPFQENYYTSTDDDTGGYGSTPVEGIGCIEQGFFGSTLGFFENSNYFGCVSNGEIQHVAPNQSNYIINTDCQRIVATEDIIIDNIKISPNPVNSILKFQSDQTYDRYTIFSSTGQKMDSSVLVNKTIQLDKLTTGIYFLKLEKDGKYIIQSFLKQ